MDFPSGDYVPHHVHWPKGVKAKGEVRTQYAHAIDLVPTVLEVLGIETLVSKHQGRYAGGAEGVLLSQGGAAIEEVASVEGTRQETRKLIRGPVARIARRWNRRGAAYTRHIEAQAGEVL